MIAFAISAALSPFYIYYSRLRQFGQQVRSDGVQEHLKKTGTPTMGGLVFLFSFVISLLFITDKTPILILAVVVTLCYALLGFIDDFRKVVRKTSLGLRAREKLIGQFVFSVLFCVILLYYGHSTAVSIPFTSLQVDFGWTYPILVMIMIAGFSNAVNLTDGVDGLAGGTSIIAFGALLLLASSQGFSDMAGFCGALCGAVLGFLIFNLHPAKVFMGDVGSLALGAALAAAAILIKAEFYLLIIGGVFVLETLSVMLQVAFFKTTGRRILLMSPLHHHFEMKGWSEWKVSGSFWGLGLVLALIGVWAYLQ